MSPVECLGVVIPAAGAGRRMGGTRKPYLELGGIPVLLHAVRAFLGHPDTRVVVVALPEEDADSPPAWLTDASPCVRIVAGGETREDSVRRGLAALPEEVGIVAVHDGARPFVEEEALNDLVALARTGAGAIIGHPVVDTVKVVDPEGRVLDTADRSRLWQVQTPQVFPRALLESAYAVADQEPATDDAQRVERAGGTVRVLRGSADNLKVTFPGDLARAERVLAERGRPRGRR